MELRLLHAAAYGEPWFAHWGYRLLSGGHGVTQETYAAAVAAVHGTPLSAVFSDQHPLLSRYTSLSQHHLHSVSDLLRLLLDLRRRLPPPPATIAAASRWPRRRIEMAACVIVEALKSAPFKWISRQQVRDAARIHVGDTGLLDHVLKSLGNHIFGRFLVRRCLDPVTKVLQYSLLDLSSLIPHFESRVRISRVQISKDLAQIYDFFFNSSSNSLLSLAGAAILDSKHLLKEFSDFSVINSGESSYFGKISPPEYMDLRGEVFGEGLRSQAEKEFREILDSKHLVKEFSDFSVINSSISAESRYFSVRIRDEDDKISPPEYMNSGGDVFGEGLRNQVEKEFREILDSKHLVKEFSDFSVVNSSISGESRYFSVRIRDEDGKISPPEYMDLRGEVFGEVLGSQVEKEFREIYWGMNEFKLGSLIDGGGELGFVFEVLKSGDGDVHERRGGEVVDCYGCGTKEDDGERMVCCEICEVWVHTRCVGIPKGEHVSPMFICARCDYAIAGSSSLL